METKADRIRYLAAQGYSTRVIADTVGCLPEYVRVAARQRKDGAYAKADITYWCKRYGTTDMRKAVRLRSAEDYADPVKRKRKNKQNWQREKRRAAEDPEFAERRRAYQRQWASDRWHNDSEYRARRAARQASLRAAKRAEARP